MAVDDNSGWDADAYQRIESSIELARFGDYEISITATGASLNVSAKKNQKAIQKAIDKCSNQGGGRVIIPKGHRFQTGAIELKSKVLLVVEDGAVLEFVYDPTLYPLVETSWEGQDCFNLSPCIYANGANDIGISGHGTIDGSGSNTTWWPWCGSKRYGWDEGMSSQREGRPRLMQASEDGEPMYTSEGSRNPKRIFSLSDHLRPQLICMNECHRVLIEDVTLLRSPFWVLHPLKCTDVVVRGVKFINDGPNGDGCDPESCNRVLIEHCYFNTGDDCIAIKSGRNNDGRRRNMASENIIVRHCEMKNGHGGVVIGSEISGGCKNVFAHDCKMDSPNLDRVLRIKTNTCRGGVVENIYMKDISVGQCRESVLKINLNYEPNEKCCRGYLPVVRNINMNNVSCNKSRYGVQIIGLDSDTLVYDINVNNCRFNGVHDGNSISGKVRNISLRNLYLNGELVIYNPPYPHLSEWMTHSEMQRCPRSYLLDFSNRPKWSYVMGIELESMLNTYLAYGGDDILAYCKEYTDTLIHSDGRIVNYKLEDYNLDNIRTGHFVARMYEILPEQKNLKALNALMNQLDQQPRTEADSIYWHKAIYAYQVWLDGTFMGLPFRVLSARMFLDDESAKKIYDDAVEQVVATYNRTLDRQTDLNRHAWDETHEMFWADKTSGLSRHCWGRAQGWYTMALVELLDALPNDYARREEVVEVLKKVLYGVLKWQDEETGLWYQVMDSPEREGNYLESTCSCMFAYALLKASRKGYVDSKYHEAGHKAYQGVLNHFIRMENDGTISLTRCCSVAGLGPGISVKVRQAAPNVKENRRRDGSFEYYLSEPVRENDAKGIGPFIWASLENEELEEKLSLR